MSPKSYLSSAITLVLLMFGLLVLMIPLGAGIGPLELSIWFAILMAGLLILLVGGLRARARSRSTA